MGDQRNYGLVTGSIWNYEDKPSSNQVSDTLGPVDRDQATIEAERGETVIYPDKDGQITHAKIGGKRHTHGGTPLDIPDGAFVYSDTRALLIKNKDLLKNIFGMNGNKAVTPAKIAKRYDLNQYNEILNDPESDPLEKRTAQLMLDNNMKKLGQLALVQEGMKGFPDGIPDIALPLFGSDLAAAQPAQEMPQAKFGGQIMRKGGRILPIHQDIGKVGSTFYLNGVPNKITSRHEGFFGSSQEDGDQWVTFEKPVKVLDEDGSPDELTEMRLSDWKKLTSKGQLNVGLEDNMLYDSYTDINNLDWWNQDRSVTDIGRGVKYNTLTYSTDKPTVGTRKSNPEYQPGYTYNMGNKTYMVVDSQVYSPYGNERQAVRVRQISDPDKNFGSYFDTKFGETLVPLTEFNALIANQAKQQQTQNSQTSSAGTPTAGTPAVRTNQQQAAWWNQHRPYIQDYVARVKNGTVSVSQVPSEYLPYLEKEGIDISKAKSVSPAATTTQNTNTSTNTGTRQAGTTTAPKKQYISDDEILKHYEEQGIPMTKDKITDAIRIRLSGMAKGGSIIMFDPVENKVLPTMQNGDQFNIYDKKYRDWLAQNKLKVITPSWWNEAYTSIGSQLPGSSSNYYLSDEGLILPKGDISGFSGVDNLIEYHEKNGVDFSKYGNAKDAAEGKKKFKENIAKVKTAGSWNDHEKATEWLLTQGEDINKQRAQKLGIDPKDMPSQIDKSKAGWNRVGTDVITGFKYLDAEDTPPPPPPLPPPPPPPPPPPTKPPGDIPQTNYTGGYPSGWTDYSTMNLATAMGMSGLTEPGALPPYMQVFPNLGRPVYMDPTANIMNQLALVNQQNEQIAGMSAPTVGRANIIAGQAAAAPNIAQTRAEYDKANAQIANTYEGQRATIMNDAELKNAMFRKQFQDDLATRRQQYLNALRNDRANVAYQFERGAKDAREMGALNVQNPNYYMDPYTGRITFKPGYNPNATASQTTEDLLDTYISKGMDANKAAALVAAQMKLNDNAFNYDPMGSVWANQKPAT
jgi:hypothetical protein